MEAEVIPIVRCKGCTGTKLAQAMEIQMVGSETMLTGRALCNECIAKLVRLLDQVRPIFDKMIECQIPEDIANEVMTTLLERME